MSAKRWLRTGLPLGLLLLLAPARALQLEGSAGVEVRLFQQASSLQGSARHGSALVLNPTLTLQPQPDWEARLTPYLRLDARDAGSRYLDLREASLRWRGANQLLRIGMETVHWGVLESARLVDVVNQVDLRADPDQEAKLGQPLLSFNWFLGEAGRLEALWMPYHRPRSGPGLAARPLAGTSDAQPRGPGPWRRTRDGALRWSATLGDLDLGLYAFRGLAREPDAPAASGRAPYRRISQWGLNAQWPQGAMLWKLEALHRRGHGQPFHALAAGGEYTLNLPSAELGLLAEWQRDHRDASAPPARVARGLFGGVRWRFFEAGDAELLYGALRDRDAGAWLHKVEFSRRLAARQRLGLVARRTSCDEQSPLAPLRNENHLQLTLTHSF